MIGRGLAIVVLLAVSYALFAGEISETEAIAGAFAVALAIGFAFVHRHAADRRLSFRGVRWGRVLLRPLLALPVDSWHVGVALAKAIFGGGGGEIAGQAFHYGDTAADAARRALVTLAASLAPNGYVIGIDGEAGTMRLHRLVPAPPQPDRDWPV